MLNGLMLSLNMLRADIMLFLMLLCCFYGECDYSESYNSECTYAGSHYAEYCYSAFLVILCRSLSIIVLRECSYIECHCAESH